MRFFVLIVFVFMFVGTCRPAAGAGPVLKNASFESNDPLDGWQPGFDNMALEPVDPSKAPVVVTREFLTPARINPFQYGQFIEYLCNLVPGMWAEKLYDGSFEGLSPYKFAYLKETDFREKPWYPAGSTNRALHHRDHSNPISGDACLKIVAEEPLLCTGGVAQDGIAVEGGLACDFRVVT